MLLNESRPEESMKKGEITKYDLYLCTGIIGLINSFCHSYYLNLLPPENKDLIMDTLNLIFNTLRKEFPLVFCSYVISITLIVYSIVNLKKFKKDVKS